MPNSDLQSLLFMSNARRLYSSKGDPLGTKGLIEKVQEQLNQSIHVKFTQILVQNSRKANHVSRETLFFSDHTEQPYVLRTRVTLERVLGVTQEQAGQGMRISEKLENVTSFPQPGALSCPEQSRIFKYLQFINGIHRNQTLKVISDVISNCYIKANYILFETPLNEPRP